MANRIPRHPKPSELNSSGGSSRDYRATGVDGSNYAIMENGKLIGGKAIDFMRLHASEGGSIGAMISRWDQPSLWAAWQHYFAVKRIPQPFMRVADKYMVPAQWPEQFDAEYFPNAERRT